MINDNESSADRSETPTTHSPPDSPIVHIKSGIGLPSADRGTSVCGEIINGYRIIRVIGEGGMGTVYEAEQESPRRKVALKLIRAGMISERMRQRFKHEVQILGLLDHAGVATIYEAGTFDSDAGRQPFFAMEFIQGSSLNEYVTQRNLGIIERLRLVVQMAEAVQHAHQKGVIHRDLKPGNILVTEQGQIKILDFGIARITESDIQATTMQTNIGQMLGTLPYMSPEQTKGEPSLIDTRSDVYALGVIAFELLAEKLPYELQNKLLLEAVRVIQDDRPSSLSGINRAYRGDIEIIIGKALEKEVERRYQSASDLANDLRRFLDHKPIEARPPSTWYHLRRFSKRNKSLVSGIVGVVIVSMLSTVISLAFARSETSQRKRADSRADEALEINRFLTDDLLSAAAPSARPGKGKDALVRDVLDVAAIKIEEASQENGRFVDKPLVEASIRSTLGATYRLLGLFDVAEKHLDRALLLRQEELGADDRITLGSLNDLAILYDVQGRYDDAERLHLKVLSKRELLLPVDHPEVLDSVNNLGLLYNKQRRLEEAEPLYVRALEGRARTLGPEHQKTLGSMNNLAVLHFRLGRYDESIRLHLQTLEIRKRILGERDPDTLGSYNNLGVVYISTEQYAKAEPMFENALEIEKQILSDEHPDLIGTMNNLGVLYKELEQYDKAKAMMTETFRLYCKVVGEDHRDTLWSMYNLVELHLLMKDYAEAEELGIECYNLNVIKYGAKHSESTDVIDVMAELYTQWEEADPNNGHGEKVKEWVSKR